MALACALWLAASPLAAATRLTLLSFNTWGGGLNEGRPIDETVAVLRATDADLAGLQEMRAESSTCSATDCPPGERSVAGPLAAALGLHVHEQSGPEEVVWACAILSRLPIVATSPNGLGAIVEVDGRRLGVFNIHPTDYPYQPYQLLDIPYGEAPFLDTAEEAVAAATATRAETLRLLREDLAWAAATEAQVIFGDFNEPSHRDWSERAAAAGRHPLAVQWPLVRALEADGFVDALRSVHPDEIAKPAYTWTPTTRPDDPADHHDRIDFVLVRGAALTVEAAGVVGEQAPEADLVVTPWPSDHRAVRVVVRID
jgi:endonuclease/exonuclease/phosphatase family metal-dependent hydrolase